MYSLRQGPDPIYDVDFVELMNDASLSQYWYGERNKDWALRIGIGAVGVPAGALLFLNNFQAQGGLAAFAVPNPNPSGNPGLTYQNVSDPRTFALSLVGVAVAMYGLYSLGLWLTEQLDTYHPNRLDEPAILPRVHQLNEDLRERLNLERSNPLAAHAAAVPHAHAERRARRAASSRCPVRPATPTTRTRRARSR